MHIRRSAVIVLIGLLAGNPLGVGTVARAVAEEGTHGERGEGEGHEEGGIQLSAERLRLAGIEVAPVEEVEFALRIRATGEVTLNADHTAHVGSRISGRIVEIYGFLGDRVDSGQAMLTLDSVELGRAKGEFRKTRARMELTRKNYEREKRLFEEQISSEREMLEAQTAYEEARIEFEAAEETLHILGMPQEEIERIRSVHESKGTTLLPVPAPFAGTIVEKHATLGEVVEPSTSLYTISDLSTVWVETHIYEKDLSSVQKGQPATVRVAAYPGETFDGTITYLSELLEEATRTVKARVEVANPDGELRPGMFAEVSVSSGERVRVPAVPETAMQNDGEGWIVYVTEDGERFREQRVRVGDRQDGYVAVVDGLELGERIAMKGSFFIKSEMAKEGFGAGHGH